MRSQDKALVAIVATVLTVALLAFAIQQHFYTARAKAAFEAGLCEGTVPGDHNIHWVPAR